MCTWYFQFWLLAEQNANKEGNITKVLGFMRNVTCFNNEGNLFLLTGAVHIGSKNYVCISLIQLPLPIIKYSNNKFVMLELNQSFLLQTII